MKFRNDALKVTSEKLDDVMTLVVVKTFSNKQKAADYLTETTKDQRIVMSLKNISYKSYLISTENFEKLLTGKDLQAYQKFYEQLY